jgi:hypothetical protein
MDRHGITLLAGQLAVLAIATVGAVAVDHFEGERQKRLRAANVLRQADKQAAAEAEQP